jgi:uncharacterized protein (UPF0333 family)
MISKRGQIGIEYLMILGAILLITIPLFFYAIYETNYKVRLNQADDTVNTLANAADTVYSMGPGSKKYVWVSIPSGVESSLVNESDIQLTLSIFGGSSDITAFSKAVLVGSVPTGQGTYRIAVEALEAGIVRIGEEYNDTTPPVILRVYPTTTSGQVICPGFITLGADTDEPATCKYDTTDPPQTPEFYSTMSSNFDGRGLTHTSTIYVDTAQSKTYYARCQDTFGNTMTTSSAISFTTGVPCGAEGTGNLTLNLSDDVGPPEVHLIKPLDGSFMNFSSVDFSYNVSDTNNSIDYCLLVAQGKTDEDEERQYYSWDSHPTQNVTQNLTTILDRGNYTWYVNCTDDSTNHNMGQSEIWSLRVNRTFFESFLTSCSGYCGMNGYTGTHGIAIGGECLENSAKCNNNCVPGFPYSPNCYIGDALSGPGKIYCTDSSAAKACCCIT